MIRKKYILSPDEMVHQVEATLSIENMFLDEYTKRILFQIAHGEKNFHEIIKELDQFYNQ